jgi:hypothetical protein
VKKKLQLWRKNEFEEKIDSSGIASGSGRVAVVPLDRGDQGGSNGTR